MTRLFYRFATIVIFLALFSSFAKAGCIQLVKLPDGRQLSYREFGNPGGKLVFYFHGLPGSHMEASLIADDIRQAGLRVIAVDRPGIAQSTYQPGRTIQDWPRDVGYLADHLGYRKFGILSTSGGTPYACACALELKHRISHIALVVPFAPVNAEGVDKSSLDTLLQIGSRHPNFAKLILSFQNQTLERNPNRAAKASVRPFLKEERAFVLDQPEVKQDFITNLEQVANQGPDGVVTEIKLLATPWGIDASDIRDVCVSIWAGGRDEIAPESMAKYFRCQIPGSRLFIKPETGHLLTFEQQAKWFLKKFQ